MSQVFLQTENYEHEKVEVSVPLLDLINSSQVCSDLVDFQNNIQEIDLCSGVRTTADTLVWLKRFMAQALTLPKAMSKPQQIDTLLQSLKKHFPLPKARDPTSLQNFQSVCNQVTRLVEVTHYLDMHLLYVALLDWTLLVLQDFTLEQSRFLFHVIPDFTPEEEQQVRHMCETWMS